MTVQLLRRRFTVDEYHRMGQAGILDEDDRLELLEGEIVEMAPIGSRHQAAVDRLNNLFARRAGNRLIVRVQGPVRLADDSEPQPDIALLRRREDFYASGHPGPGDVFLLVEVSDTSTEYDREVKLPIYARNGIAEVWLAGLGNGAIEVFRNPSSKGYAETVSFGPGQTLAPSAFPGFELGVDEVLG